MKQKYCEMSTPKCSEDCCDYSGCLKQARFDYIANKYNTTPDKIAIGTNFQFEKIVIEDREYYSEEVLEILKKHKEEEDKKYQTCDICGNKYLENNMYNMCQYDLDENPKAYAVGYSSTPYIKGIKILSTCGKGKDIKMCDKCISLLVKWLKKEG